MENGYFTIELTPAERTLVETMQFDPLAFRGDHVAFRKNADLAFQLATGLLDRDCVPEQRRRYFTDPEYNPGGHGRSRMGGFERNGTSGDDILRHPHFLKYLRYFIFGADLPASVLQAFARAVEACCPITSGDIAPLGSTARRLTRDHQLESSLVADEFYKLCLDLGLSAGHAASIRKSVQQVRLRR